MQEIVSSDADVAAVLPVEYLEEETAPVRDALIHAHAAQQEAYQAKSAYASSQADIRTATGRFLAALARDRGFQKQAGESADDFRARVLGIPLAVTPEVIVATVNAILATVGAGECQYLESIADRFYVNATGGTGICAGVLGASPINPTRLYPEDLSVNGAERPNSSPGSAWAFSDEIGRYFVLRVPNLAALDTSIPTPWSSTSTAALRPVGTGSLFLYNPSTVLPTGSNALNSQCFLYFGLSTAIDTYKAINDAVTRLVGHSIRWMLISDSRL